MTAFKAMASEVLQILITCDYNPIDVGITLVVSSEDLDKIHVEDVDNRSKLEMGSRGKLGEVWWSCVLRPTSTRLDLFGRLPTTEDKQLRSLLRKFADYFESQNLPLQFYQVNWVLETTDFYNKFVDHPNLVSDEGIQASEDIKGVYCSIQIVRTLSTGLHKYVPGTG